jgi:RHS repeat-associated protein
LQPRHLFTDQERDAETGLDYFHARFYDPWVGRFLEQDPELGGASAGVTFDRLAGDASSLNAHAYVRNRPTGLVDPTGRFDSTYWFVPTFTAHYEGGGSVTQPMYNASGGLQVAIIQATHGGTQTATIGAIIAAGTLDGASKGGGGNLGNAATGASNTAGTGSPQANDEHASEE